MPSVLSTKKLLPNQRELLLNAGLSFVEYDAISIKEIPFKAEQPIKNGILSSQNGVAQILAQGLSIEQSFVVGKKTAALLTEKGLKVVEIAKNSTELAHFIAKNHKNEHFYYFCGNKRRDELPTILKETKVSFEEVITYETSLKIQSFDQNFDGVLFYSPSGVEAFAKANPQSLPLKEEKEGCIAFCIGETTADEARKYTDNIIVSNATTIESTIARAVNYLKKKI